MSKNNDIITIYKFLILLFVINVFISGINFGYIVLMIVLLFIYIDIIRHI